MCGICGKYYFQPVGTEPIAALIQRMTHSMIHRGPDDQGSYIRKGIGLGHRRLSIIDLDTGKQPLANEDGSVVVVFNGEIYNYQTLRDTLLGKGHIFKTRSDTEVIVHSYEEYGEKFLEKLRGMFAIALWDNRNHTLLLARDRLGIKPLYFSTSPDWIVFSSEIKGILQDEDFGAVEVNPDALDGFLRFYFIPGQETIFRGIRRLLPGYYLAVKDGNVQEHQYWDLNFGRESHDLDFDGLKHNLDALLRETVRGHMLSDVPVGFLLSGGVDSTALLSYATHETNKEVSSFTVGFSGEDFADEREYAKLAARTFGSRYYDMTISPEDFIKFLPEYIWHMEEPVCEPPAIALYYISKLASNYVKVLISGEGGDEAFAGYPNYANYPLARRIGNLIGPFGKLASPIIRNVFGEYAAGKYKKYGFVIGEEFKNFYFSRTSGPHTFFNENYESIYTNGMVAVRRRNEVINGFMNDLYCRSNDLGFLEKMLYIDSKTWLPDDLLIKADKMTMANSVELRVPFLDHKVVEFAANVPSKYKVNGRTTKYLLKETLKNVVPEQILARKKTGFPVPYERWLRNEMKDSIQEVLLDGKSLNRNYFNKRKLEEVIKLNQTKGWYSKEIFCLYVLELWHRTFLDTPQILQSHYASK
jgi:asparagine synthase (glutamine-hydrolysing)